MLEFPVFLVLKYFFYWDPTCGSFLTTTTGTARTPWVLSHSTAKGAALGLGWGRAAQSSAGKAPSHRTGSCPAAGGQMSYFCSWTLAMTRFVVHPLSKSDVLSLFHPPSLLFSPCPFFSLILRFFLSYPAPPSFILPSFFSSSSQTDLLKYKAWPLLKKGEDVLFLFKLCTCLDVFTT